MQLFLLALVAFSSPAFAQLDFWNKPKTTAPSIDAAMDNCMQRMKTEAPKFIKDYSKPGEFLHSDKYKNIEILRWKCEAEPFKKWKDRGDVRGYLLWMETDLMYGNDPTIEKVLVLVGDTYPIKRR